MTDYAETCGDKMPDIDKIVLPSCMTKKEVYRLYAEEELQKKNIPISKISFWRLWKMHFKNIIIPKVGTTWASIVSRLSQPY